jgi:hypothetical protein
MKTVTISSRSKAIHSLLRMAQDSAVLLQATDGSQFILTPVTDVQAFSVGESDELSSEIAIARANQALMKFLDERGRQAQPGKGIPLEKVRQQLGL